jgi:UDP-3-O-[3-hydroxymyristoyl] N-acetylglucosamine deacetylase
VIPIGERPQRTLLQTVLVSGRGIVTGSEVTLRFQPAPSGSGISFQRTDRPGAKPIPALASSVTGTNRRTTLGDEPNSVTLVEHVLAALAGLRIDNCVVELNGPEPPGLDGSARGFVRALLEGGIVLQNASRQRWMVAQPLILRQGGVTLSMHPIREGELRISYLLDYGVHAPIAPQAHTETITPDSFQHELADSRTFLLEREARELQEAGVGKHLSASEVIVFGSGGPIDNTLRHPDEPARHKILDLVGDLALSGLDVAGHVVAYRSGHPLNVELARTLSRSVRAQTGRVAPQAA